MYLQDICSRPTAQSSLHTVVLLAVIQTVSDKYIVTYYYTILYIYYTIYYTVLDNVQAGRVEPASGPILVRRPYVWHPGSKETNTALRHVLGLYCLF